jgi:hypothetical protein
MPRRTLPNAMKMPMKLVPALATIAVATGGIISIFIFYIGQTGSTPPIAKWTRFDPFMIATCLIYLVNIVLAVVIVRFEEKKNEGVSELNVLVASGAVPGLSLLVWSAVVARLV